MSTKLVQSPMSITDDKKCINSSDTESNLPGYKCIKLLGQGGFGTTYLMENDKGDKIVVKVVEDDNDIIIYNEDIILKKLSTTCSKRRVLCYNKKFHTYYNVFFITEYIDGSSLADYKIKDPAILYKLFAQIIDAVEYIHSLDIVHFDIKPDNIMVTKDDNIKLIDFGGASMKSKQHTVYFNIHTAYFAPPGNLSNYMSFVQGTYFDWFTVMTTLIYVLKNIKDIPEDLKKFQSLKKENLPFDVNIMQFINDLKEVIDSHIESSTENFIKEGFKSNVRTITETKIPTVSQKSKSKISVKKIASPQKKTPVKKTDIKLVSPDKKIPLKKIATPKHLK